MPGSQSRLTYHRTVREIKGKLSGLVEMCKGTHTLTDTGYRLCLCAGRQNLQCLIHQVLSSQDLHSLLVQDCQAGCSRSQSLGQGSLVWIIICIHWGKNRGFEERLCNKETLSCTVSFPPADTAGLGDPPAQAAGWLLLSVWDPQGGKLQHRGVGPCWLRSRGLYLCCPADLVTTWKCIGGRGRNAATARVKRNVG